MNKKILSMLPSLYQAESANPTSYSHDRGAIIYEAGHPGHAWRVVSGAVRLDRASSTNSELAFASVAVTGDVIAPECFLSGHYEFTARAFMHTVLMPWQEATTSPSAAALLYTLSGAEKRHADIVALRCGSALDRVRRLLSLLTGYEAQRMTMPFASPPLARSAMPSLKDMSEITALTIETVSRNLSRLAAEGWFSKAVVGRWAA